MNSKFPVRSVIVFPVIASAGLALSACSSNSIQKAAANPVPAAVQSWNPVTQVAVPTLAPTSASASTSDSTTGPVGTTFTVNTTDDSDNKVTYDVTLNKVVSPASPDNEFDAAPSGKRLVGAEFTIKGVSGTISDDANSDAAIQGADEQVYDPGFETLSVGTNFDSGDFNVSPGRTDTAVVDRYRGT